MNCSVWCGSESRWDFYKYSLMFYCDCARHVHFANRLFLKMTSIGGKISMIDLWGSLMVVYLYVLR